MNKIIKNKKGITLTSLVITIIVLTIIAGISIMASKGTSSNISDTSSGLEKSKLYNIQQLLFENYLKYKQSNNSRFLRGIKMSYADAKTQFDTLGFTDGENLKEDNYDSRTAEDGEYYYKLQPWHLQEMGMDNLKDEEFIVNYSTGEVFNITNKKTEKGEILYIYKK